MRMLAAALLVLGLTVGAGPARAHDDGEREHRLRFRTSLVADADAGDLGIGSVAGSFVAIDDEDGGRVRLALVGVTDMGMPASVAMCELAVTGLADGAPLAATFPFDLLDGAGGLRATLGLDPGTLLEIEAVTVACPPAGVFAVPGVTLGNQDGEHEEDDDLVIGADRRGRDDDHDDGDDDHDDGDRDDDDDDEAPRDGFLAPLVGDADSGDFGLDSTAGSFVRIDAGEGGEVKLRLAGVTDGAGQPVDHAGNVLVITGSLNAMPFVANLPFDLVDGMGGVHTSLGLMVGDVLVIESVSVSDGANVFAVPGFFVRDGDEDSDGVPDGDDACHGTSAERIVSGDGCSLAQRCACTGGRRALRTCLRGAARGLKAELRATCGSGKSCRREVRRLVAERRATLKSCPLSRRR